MADRVNVSSLCMANREFVYCQVHGLIECIMYMDDRLHAWLIQAWSIVNALLVLVLCMDDGECMADHEYTSDSLMTTHVRSSMARVNGWSSASMSWVHDWSSARMLMIAWLIDCMDHNGWPSEWLIVNAWLIMYIDNRECMAQSLRWLIVSKWIVTKCTAL
jgi:hypothetical protein